MAFGKSFRTNKDKEMIMLSKQFAKINGEYEKKDRMGEIEILLNNKKIGCLKLRQPIFINH